MPPKLSDYFDEYLKEIPRQIGILVFPTILPTIAFWLHVIP